MLHSGGFHPHGRLSPLSGPGALSRGSVWVGPGVALGHEWLGVGGSFTEASAVTWRKLTERRRQEIITAYFHPSSGLGFNLGRVPIGSCDSSLENWTCGDISEGAALDGTPPSRRMLKGDMDLKGFSLERYEEPKRRGKPRASR
ncbi:unnamed protein product [Durusdinium trenchii]|uniref:Glycosyl hydrolase family 30 TIM-barrel domain-containing protein n=1 Tax=Durusdinium trenchii TaxID=1381693 RepID=A0ABP0N8Q1_9DINO